MATFKNVYLHLKCSPKHAYLEMGLLSVDDQPSLKSIFLDTSDYINCSKGWYAMLSDVSKLVLDVFFTTDNSSGGKYD